MKKVLKSAIFLTGWLLVMLSLGTPEKRLWVYAVGFIWARIGIELLEARWSKVKKEKS